MRKTYESEALPAIHETASDLNDAGRLDKRTLKEFDTLCLTPVVDLSAEEIQKIRLKARYRRGPNRVVKIFW